MDIPGTQFVRRSMAGFDTMDIVHIPLGDVYSAGCSSITFTSYEVGYCPRFYDAASFLQNVSFTFNRSLPHIDIQRILCPFGSFTLERSKLCAHRTTGQE